MKLIPNKDLAAVCGLFCPACSLYIATNEDPERLKNLAQMFNLTEEEVKCYGCRSHKRGPYCKVCKMYSCAQDKGVDFCSQCQDYPCNELKAFQEAAPHRIELWKDLDRIRDAGFEKWYKESLGNYCCEGCGTLNSAYDLLCRSCGNDPGSKYGGRHKDAVNEYLKDRS